jgi:hypothetical protein
VTRQKKGLLVSKTRHRELRFLHREDAALNEAHGRDGADGEAERRKWAKYPRMVHAHRGAKE